MAHNIALQFEDSVTRVITCDDNQLLCEAAYRAKINIPLDCRDGACGTCKCFVESGTYDKGSYIEDALTDDEAEQGYVLSCQMRPRTDCVVRVPASSAACKTQVSKYEGKIAAVGRDSPTTATFSVQLGERVAFLPGQYVNIGVPGTTQTRAYSFSSAPGEDKVEFLIRDVPGGLMSGYIRSKAEVGDTVSFDGPYGSFYLRPQIRPMLMLAGGTGLAPFLSMLRWIEESPNDQPILLAYGVNTNDDLVELAELERLKTRIEGFDYFTVVVDKASGHPRTGYVTDHLGPHSLHEGNVDVYVCGPPPMVEGVRSWMSGVGVTPRNFLFEKFNSASEGGHK